MSHSFWWDPRKLGRNQAIDTSFNLVKTETTLPKDAPKNQLSLLTKLVLQAWFHSTYSPVLGCKNITLLPDKLFHKQRKKTKR